MTLRYLYHSGFMIEADDFTMVIDYYKDDCEGQPAAEKGVVAEDTLARPGDFYVLSSHAHHDHYNKRVLDWAGQRSGIRYIFSFDIRGKAPEDMGITFLERGGEYRDGKVDIKAFGSTDAGVSFVIKAGGKTIFHAGDLNNWHWKDVCPEEEWRMYENSFLRELDKIYAYVQGFDLAMFPVDQRLGKEYARGAEQFLDKFDVKVFSPMHFAEHYDSIARFEGVAKGKCQQYKLWGNRGETIEF